jgi:hypothetical protein
MKICTTCQQSYSDDLEFCPRDGAHLAAQATETEAQLAAGLSRRFRIVRRLGAGAMGAVFENSKRSADRRLCGLRFFLESRSQIQRQTGNRQPAAAHGEALLSPKGATYPSPGHRPGLSGQSISTHEP